MLIDLHGQLLNGQHRRQGDDRRQGRAEIVRRQAKLAGMGRQALAFADRMLDSVRSRRPLGEDEHEDEEEAAEQRHAESLIDLDEQAFEVFAFREVQCHRMIGRARQATHDTRLAPGIDRRAGDDFLEQLQPDTA